MSEKKALAQLKAIRKVIDILNKDWIVESCGDYAPVMGCASCRAIDIKDDLKMLACAIMEDQDYDPNEVAKW